MTRDRVYQLIDRERSRQDEKFPGDVGGWQAFDVRKLTVLVEEVGEVARAILEQDELNKRDELVQCAAVIAKWLESELE